MTFDRWRCPHCGLVFVVTCVPSPQHWCHELGMVTLVPHPRLDRIAAAVLRRWDASA